MPLKRGQNIKYLPFDFTAHGAIMTATVLNRPQAVQIIVFVVRAVIRMREHLLIHAEIWRNDDSAWLILHPS